ncbi:MAG TPA: FGGY-family carbohydrate kinase [Anaerolineales bacterium]|nr:FGGY-family carbohydrate kinase [Anaerolineales bacterium]
MQKKYILAHDTGTGGDKAVLTDLQGRVLQSAYQPYEIYYPQPDWAEQSPEELWQAVAKTTRQVIQKAGIEPGEILGVGISAQMFNLLPVDERCQPVTPMLSWLDVRSVHQADRLLSGDTPAFLFNKTGNIPTAKDVIPKILWLKEARPDLWARTAKLLDCKEYILFRLTGKIAIDWHGASVFFLFDPYQKIWSKEVCETLGIPLEKLPEAYPCTQVIGEVTSRAAAETGLAPGTPVVICAGDVAVAQSGSGANAAGKAHLCIGTATWVGLSTRVFQNDPEKPFWALNHIDPDKWIIAGEMETGGGALMWFRDAFCQEEDRQASAAGISTYQLLGQMADSVEPGSDKLLFLPWLSGERAPVLDHYARGGFVGLSLSHTKSHLARSVMEGVAFHLRWICESLERLGLTFDSVNAIGGGSTSPVWTQIISDIIERPLRVVEHPQEAGAMGAALSVAVGLGILPNMEAVDEVIRIDHTVEPRAINQRRYGGLYQEYRTLYEALAPIYRNLHNVD